MIGIIIVAHGTLAQAFLQTMEMIIGPQESCEIICIICLNTAFGSQVLIHRRLPS